MAEVKFQDLIHAAETLRLDPEYFQKIHLHDEKVIARNPDKFTTFSDAKLTVDASAFYPSIEPYYGTGSLPFLRVADVDKVIDFEGCTTIPQELTDIYPTLNRVNKGDIVLTKGGSVARVGLVTDSAAVSRDLIYINSSRLKEHSSYALSTYFQTDFFRRLLVRSSSQTAQPHLTITLVRNLPLLRMSEDFEKRIASVLKKANETRESALSLQQQAEALLLSALGLEQWQPPEALTYERSAKEVFEAGRLDAEHFKPKFYAVWEEAKLATGIETIRLGDMIEPVKNGFDFRNFSEDGTPYIRVGDVKNLRIDTEGAAKVAISQGDFSKDIQLREGDILFTRKGSFGNAAVVRAGQQHCIISSEIMLVRLKVEYSENILPDYLSIFLESKLGKLQSEQWAHGVAFYSISQADFENYRIPLLDLSKQVELMDKVVKSQSAQNQSLQLLEMAKRAVEMAIEESEAAALTYLAAHAPALA